MKEIVENNLKSVKECAQDICIFHCNCSYSF